MKISHIRENRLSTGELCKSANLTIPVGNFIISIHFDNNLGVLEDLARNDMRIFRKDGEEEDVTDQCFPRLSAVAWCSPEELAKAIRWCKKYSK